MAINRKKDDTYTFLPGTWQFVVRLHSAFLEKRREEAFINCVNHCNRRE